MKSQWGLSDRVVTVSGMCFPQLTVCVCIDHAGDETERLVRKIAKIFKARDKDGKG